MKKYIFWLIAVSLFISLNISQPVFSKDKKKSTTTTQQKKREKKVYICDSKEKSVYHKSKDCYSLRTCKNGLIEMNLSKAKTLFKPCKKCCK